LNWSGDSLPDIDSDVTMDAPGAATVVYDSAASTTVKSLTIRDSLRIEQRALTVQQAFVADPGLVLSVNGAGSEFTAASEDELLNLSILVTAGGLASLPAVTSYSSAGGRTAVLRATDAGSVLDLSNVVHVDFSLGYEASLFIEALAGGTVDLSQATEISDTAIATVRAARLTADGAGSTIDLSSLTKIEDNSPWYGDRNWNASLTATNSGAISVGINTRLKDVNVTIDATSVINGSLNLDSGTSLSGRGQVSGNLTNTGGIVYSSGLRVHGDYVQGAAGTFAAQIFGSAASGSYSRMLVDGDVVVAGKLDITRPYGYVPVLGEQFEVISGATTSGTFDEILGASTGGGIKLHASYQSDTIALLAGLDVPVADILNVSPDPRNAPVGVVTIQFDRAVMGVDIGDFTLTHNGAYVDLSSLSVVQVTPQQYTIDLSSVTTTDGTYVLTLQADRSGIVDSSAIALVTDVADTFVIDTTAPQVDLFKIADGSSQRSVVRSLTVTFDSLVTIDPGAFVLTTKSGTPVNVNVSLAEVSGVTQAILTFTGSRADASGSLIDGNYRLQILATHVRDSAGNSLDGNSDTVAGDAYVDEFFRLFGDVDGDRDVDANDHRAFQSTYRKRQGQAGFMAAFDADGDGDVDASDLFAFRQRFGLRLNP
jgi:cytoskeletal protein CcmA (bactofilin family)